MLCLVACAAVAWPAFAGVEEGLKAYDDRDFDEVARQLLPQPPQADARVKAVLGTLFLHGWSVPRDVPRGLALLRDAAAQGNDRGLHVLGYAHEHGIGMEKDETQAAALYHKGAELGYAGSYNNLSSMYLDGRGVRKDVAKAREFLHKGAELGDPNSRYSLGWNHDVGRDGEERDLNKAFYWYLLAAQQGHTKAQNAVGLSYQNGEGVEKDFAQAIAWLTKSAQSGNVYALTNLGRTYQFAKGVDKDMGKAIEFYRLSALQGHPRGQLHLANAYASRWSDNPNPNHLLAYFWYLVMGNTTDSATVQSSSDGMSKIFHRVPSEKRAEIERDMRNWKPGQDEPVYTVADALMPKPQAPREAGERTGSGFRINKDMVLTNHHVAGSCKKLLVNGQPATLLASDSNADIALVAVKDLPGDVPQIRAEPARVGEDIAVAGFPLRGLLSGFNMTRGSVSSLSGIGGDTRLLQITAPVQPGNSGGPLVDSAGRVVGMVVSKLSWKTVNMTGSIPENVNFAINGNTLTSFLQAHQAAFSGGSGAAKTLSPPDVADKGRGFTVLVNCSP